ncbi:MAG: type VI secretion system tube protein Hcp [Azoarcus sp.]|jgi:type VI secretion system secreted protein Hcp|nr:type VI secretion system tube protein Hcp [Azoarcus sp.]
MSIYVKVEGITGESRDAKHKGWIDALSVDFGVVQSSSMSTGGGGGVGKADFPALTFAHYVDRATPNLFKYCAAGKHIPKVEISVTKSGGGQEEYQRITLGDVLVVSSTPSGSADALWVETVGLSYATISIEVREQNANGSMSAPITGTWDVKQNRE